MNELEKCCKILKNSKRIAVYGISRNANRTSREIADFLVRNGYEVVGVNPAISKAGEIDVYPSLRDIPFEVDIVDVFRRSEDIPELIEDVLAIKPKTLWLQQGIRNDEAVKPVKEAGIETVQDTCIAVMHSLCRSN
jgi:uncharacterized protein